MKICDCAEYLMTEHTHNWETRKETWDDILRCRTCELIYKRPWGSKDEVTVFGRQDKEFEQYWFYGY
jgi:hypothetical protein